MIGKNARRAGRAGRDRKKRVPRRPRNRKTAGREKPTVIGKNWRRANGGRKKPAPRCPWSEKAGAALVMIGKNRRHAGRDQVQNHDCAGMMIGVNVRHPGLR